MGLRCRAVICFAADRGSPSSGTSVGCFLTVPTLRRELNGLPCVLSRRNRLGPLELNSGAENAVARRRSVDAGGVDHKSVPHIAVDDAVVRLVDAIRRDGLDVSADPVLSAEVQHLLGPRDPADH